MKYIFHIILISSILFVVNCSQAQSNVPNDTMYIRCINTLDFATLQAKRLYNSLPINPSQFPRSITSVKSIAMVNSSDWTSGFFPGELWYLSDYKNDLVMQTIAAKYTQLLNSQQYNTSTHDLGFMMFCSYGNGLKFANTTGYQNILIQTAQSLKSRFNQNVGSIRSWDFGTWSYPVIIDNLMNLELLTWATSVTGDSSYHKSAVSHAEKTMANHYRADFSSFHLVDYNTSTGAVIGKQTHQGYSNSSSWARGQAWGLYGFTMMYRETKIQAFLTHAINIADYILKNTPSDYVPYWDYNDPSIPAQSVPRDASAAAITTSALIELFQFTQNPIYLYVAEKTLWNLSSPKYMNSSGENKNFLIKHCTGNKPSNSEIDVPLIYGDYYFVEALYRYVKFRNLPSSIPTHFVEDKVIQVYPSQFNKTLTVKSTLPFDQIQLLDLTGKIIMLKAVPSCIQNTLSVSDDLKPGIYIVKVFNLSHCIGIEKIMK